MNRFALGLFQMNVQEVVGEQSAHHRYISQVVLPVFHLLRKNSQLRITIATTGQTLEFIAAEYPQAIDWLRQLIVQGQVELLASTYNAAAWFAFPGSDLDRSIEINRAVLANLELPESRIFFSPEGLCGAGLARVARWFDIVLCKDHSLRIFKQSASGTNFFRLSNLLLFVGANHLTHEVATHIVRKIKQTKNPSIDAVAEAHVDEAVNSLAHSSSAFVDGQHGDVAWHWYHFGPAHAITTTGHPRAWDTFYANPNWTQLCVDACAAHSADGYRSATVGELIFQLPKNEQHPEPLLVECGWNPHRDQGIYRWMGRQEHKWEPGSALPVLVWRARQALRRLENAAKESAYDLSFELSAAWKEMVLAESAAPLAAGAATIEMNSTRERSDRILQMVTRAAFLLGQEAVGEVLGLQQEIAKGKRVDAPIIAELVGADGEIVWTQIAENEYLCELKFRAEEAVCGVRFKCGGGTGIRYCPSGSEEHAFSIDLEAAEYSELYLPLANGYLSIDHEKSLIRHNSSFVVAAYVANRAEWVSFLTDGGSAGRTCEWKLSLFVGPEQEAIRAANRINVV